TSTRCYQFSQSSLCLHLVRRHCCPRTLHWLCKQIRWGHSRIPTRSRRVDKLYSVAPQNSYQRCNDGSTTRHRRSGTPQAASRRCCPRGTGSSRLDCKGSCSLEGREPGGLRSGQGEVRST